MDALAFFTTLLRTEVALGLLLQKERAFIAELLDKVQSAAPLDLENVKSEITNDELRLFYSTTIGHFAKLQENYLQQELEHQKLRHIISALQLRHLLEHLPTQIPGSKSGQWQAFWTKALEEENKRYTTSNTSAKEHPLKSVVDARNPKRVDKNGDISKDDARGQLYRTGNDLYGILSDEIHGFCGGQYEIAEGDGWTKLVTETLQALKPLHTNIDHVTGQVNWKKERKRYV